MDAGYLAPIRFNLTFRIECVKIAPALLMLQIYLIYLLGSSFHVEIVHSAVKYPGLCNGNNLASLSELFFLRLSDDISSLAFELL